MASLPVTVKPGAREEKGVLRIRSKIIAGEARLVLEAQTSGALCSNRAACWACGC